MADAADNSGRDKNGRFGPGNPGGPGGSRKRAFVLRRAAEEAVTVEHVQAIIRKATRMALEGNLSAMRLVLERTSGRVAEAPVEAEPVDIALPRLKSASDCNVALERLIDAVVKGTIDREVAKLLIDAVHARVKAIDVSEMEQRLLLLEQTVKQVRDRTK